MMSELRERGKGKGERGKGKGGRGEGRGVGFAERSKAGATSECPFGDESFGESR